LTRLLGLLALATSASAFTAGVTPSLRARPSSATALALAAPPAGLAARTLQQRAAAPTMGLFGLGAPELAVIGAVALFILGPDKLKELAKDVGKVSAELKQVPEEFNKGMEIGAEELEKKKASPPAVAEAAPPSAPPAA